MWQALGMFAAIAAVLFSVDCWSGHEAAHEIEYGALSLMGATIAAT
jgi:hypothetical protein